MQAFFARAVSISLLLLLATPATTGCSSAAPLPPKALALNQAGAEALQQGELDIAEARLSLALEYNPHFVEALTNLATVETQRGNFARARELLLRARRLNADIAQPHHALGVLAEREGRADVASQHYRDALRVDPGFAPSRANYARLLFRAGMIEHARIQFLRLTQVAPDRAEGFSGLAESLLRLGRVSEAEAVVAHGLERHRDDPYLIILDARRLLRLQRIDEALALLTPLTTAHDDAAVAALGWVAVGELARGQPRAALDAAARGASLNAGDDLIVYATGKALTALGDPRAPAWVERSRH